MGCSPSKVNDNDDDDAVQICRDRRNFIKQAIEQRNRFASSHVAYIHSLLRVSFALCYFFEGDERRHFLDFDTSIPSKSAKILIPEKLMLHLKQSEGISLTVNCLRSVGNPSIPMEQWPQSPETVRIESYYPIDHQETEGFFITEDRRTNPPFFSSSYNGQNCLQEPPQWDFWNPFSSIDGYGYAFPRTPDCLIIDEGLRRAREDEGVPELEEVEDEDNKKIESSPVCSRSNSKTIDKGEPCEMDNKAEETKEGKELNSHSTKRLDASEERKMMEVNNERRIGGSAQVGEEETRGFVVYVNQRPTSMAEVMKDLEIQFAKICDSSSEVSVLLETRTAGQYPTLPRASTSANADGNDDGSDSTDESAEIFKSHKSTLDRLYMWEKKLYEEVKVEEQIRFAYEKKCTLLKKQDANGAEPSAVDKTRAAVRDLQTKLRVSISSIEYISERIEILRDEELHPQLVELIKGLARMWRATAESHRIQRRTLDEAKLLLLSSAAAAARKAAPPRSHRAAAVLAAELRLLRASLASWVGAQRGYAAALAGWISRCAPPLPDDSGGGGEGAAPPPPVYGICVGWARVLEGVREEAALEAIEAFAAAVAAAAAEGRRRRREGAAAAAAAGEEEEGEGERMVAAGAAEAVGAAAELAGAAAEGYEDLVRALEEEEESDRVAEGTTVI